MIIFLIASMTPIRSLNWSSFLDLYRLFRLNLILLCFIAPETLKLQPRFQQDRSLFDIDHVLRLLALLLEMCIRRFKDIACQDRFIDLRFKLRIIDPDTHVFRFTQQSLKQLTHARIMSMAHFKLNIIAPKCLWLIQHCLLHAQFIDGGRSLIFLQFILERGVVTPCFTARRKQLQIFLINATTSIKLAELILDTDIRVEHILFRTFANRCAKYASHGRDIVTTQLKLRRHNP
mmetsp:Transcript_22666/g.36373  ORF Transcript_22666/g.36373 Transcript_22666/m.36373 type:complete len:233 (+) Transcript_22666:1112-1810(+)